MSEQQIYFHVKEKLPESHWIESTTPGVILKERLLYTGLSRSDAQRWMAGYISRMKDCGIDVFCYIKKIVS